MRNSQQSAELQELSIINQNPTAQANALHQVTPNTNVHSAAMEIWECSGQGYPWWHWKYYTENDEGMYDAIMSVSTGGNVPMALREAYYIVSTGHNLQTDMNSLLDAQYMNTLTW